ncbi:unnamed protein product [Coregonus sp. 'balchen']|nr:unnamed protein product [Coregonus sp. 'balchen']
MERWKSHVRTRLFQRDCTQKDPFSGIFNTLSKLAEQLDLRDTLWDELQRPSSEGDGGLMVDHRELHLQLRESEHITEKLSQTVSDLTTVLYLKDAELQYCHSHLHRPMSPSSIRVSRYRKEAVTQARGANVLQASLSEFEFALESQSKELAALRLEQRELREGLAAAWREKEELLERWMDEKKEEAERVNRHNDTQER